MTTGLFDTDGRVRFTVSPGTGFVGLYTPDGSYYGTVVDGSHFVGLFANDGSINISNATGDINLGLLAADGSLRVTLDDSPFNGAMRISGVTFGPPSYILLENGVDHILTEDGLSVLILGR